MFDSCFTANKEHPRTVGFTVNIATRNHVDRALCPHKVRIIMDFCLTTIKGQRGITGLDTKTFTENNVVSAFQYFLRAPKYCSPFAILCILHDA